MIKTASSYQPCVFEIVYLGCIGYDVEEWFINPALSKGPAKHSSLGTRKHLTTAVRFQKLPIIWPTQRPSQINGQDPLTGSSIGLFLVGIRVSIVTHL